MTILQNQAHKMRVFLRDTDGAHPGYRRMEDVRTDAFCLYVLFDGLLGTETSIRTNTVCTPQLTQIQTNQPVGIDKWGPPSVPQMQRVHGRFSAASCGFLHTLITGDFGMKLVFNCTLKLGIFRWIANFYWHFY